MSLSCDAIASLLAFVLLARFVLAYGGAVNFGSERLFGYKMDHRTRQLLRCQQQTVQAIQATALTSDHVADFHWVPFSERGDKTAKEERINLQ